MCILNGSGKISCQEAETITRLLISNKSIRNLDGIEAFINSELLNCTNVFLKSIDVSNNHALTDLYLGGNLLTSLDVSNNISLIEFICNNNQLTSLDVSNNKYLKLIACGNNSLTTLNVSDNIFLNRLECEANKLTSLDISKNTLLEFLNISEMSSLFKVCVWITPFPPEGKYFDLYSEGSPNFYFTTDCSKLLKRIPLDH